MNMYNHQIMLPDGSQLGTITNPYNIHPNIQPNIQPNIHPNIQPNIQPNINPNTVFGPIPPSNMYNNYNSFKRPQHNIKRDLEKHKVTDLLTEMINNYKNKETPSTNTVDNQVSKYLLLFSVDPEFRTKICELVNRLYKKKTEPKHINEKTLRFLVSNNNGDIMNIYETHNASKFF